MPLYDYQCNDCNATFEQHHGMNTAPSPCPNCNSTNLQRLITSAPAIARGMLTPAGSHRGATKEELRDKWREETPKLRRQLVDRLGEDTVNRLGSTSLNATYDND